MIGIIGAMDEEVSKLKEAMEDIGLQAGRCQRQACVRYTV